MPFIYSEIVMCGTVRYTHVTSGSAACNLLDILCRSPARNRREKYRYKTDLIPHWQTYGIPTYLRVYYRFQEPRYHTTSALPAGFAIRCVITIGPLKRAKKNPRQKEQRKGRRERA